jgi:hypothetical protein
MAPLILLVCKFKPKFQGYALFGLFAVASHIFLDVFAGYTPVLWPLYGYSVWIKADFIVHIGSSSKLAITAQLLTEPINFQPFQSLDAPLFTGEGLILSAVLLMPVFLKAFKAWWKSWRSRNHVLGLC